MYATLSDPRMYILAWMTVNKITITGKGGAVDSRHRDLSQIIDSMYLDYVGQVKEYNKDNEVKISKPSIKDLEAALREYVHIKTKEVRANTIEELSYLEDNDLLLQFVEACTGTKDETTAAVLAHWMWGVKNRAMNRQISYHICPVFFSVSQGSGKSTAIKRLTSPFAEYRGDYDVSQIADSRFQPQLGLDLIGVLDEMSGASRTDVEALKRVVTANQLSIRRLGTNIVSEIFICCSFIGSSNKHMSELVQDGSMRRFFQIKTLDKIDWKLINSLDYKSMWRAVDENREDGYIKSQMLSIVEEQETYKASEPVQEFMEENLLSAIPKNAPYSLVLFKDVIKSYQEWCIANGARSMNANWFSAKMATFGQKSKKIKDGKVVRTYYEVSPQCKLPKATPENFKEINGLEAL